MKIVNKKSRHIVDNSELQWFFIGSPSDKKDVAFDRYNSLTG